MEFVLERSNPFNTTRLCQVWLFVKIKRSKHHPYTLHIPSLTVESFTSQSPFIWLELFCTVDDMDILTTTVGVRISSDETGFTVGESRDTELSY